jgi:hypothetical protein
MAQQTILVPNNPYKPPNTRDVTPGDGESIKDMGDKINSNFTELYTAIGAATAAQIAEAVATAGLLGSTTVAADVLPIPVTHKIVLKTTGIDAEALTLADGVAGQKLLIQLATDGGGDGTLTPTTSTGWATIVFADAGDCALLRYVDDTIGWIIESLYGLTAQPAYTL